MRFNFLIVDDEKLIREGLTLLLRNEPFVGSIQEAGDKPEFLNALNTNIDFVLLDFKLADTNGMELLVKAKELKKSIKVIVLTGLEGSELILNLLKAGVNGIVYKLDGYGEIRRSIQKVIDGGTWYSDRVMAIIQKNAHRWDNVPPVILNFTEREILVSVAMGLTTMEISERTKMAETTVETYRARLMKKVGVSNTASLLAYAFRNGLL